MSSENNNTAPATETPVISRAQELRDIYDDKGKFIAMNADQLDDFATLTATFDESDPLVDWSGKAPESFTTLAIVKTAEKEINRMIAIPSKEAAFAHPSVMQWLYAAFVRQVLKVARSDEATEAQFVSADGAIKARYDITAFKSQAMNVVKWLREQGLNGMTVAGLKAALSNAAFATSNFPRAKAEQWKALLQRMIALAEKKGHDTSLFTFWLATRDAKVDTGAEITFDFDAFDDVEEEATEANTAPALATA